MSSFSKLAVVTASTQRKPVTGVVEGAAVTHIASLKCLPLDPASLRSLETIRQLNLGTSLNLLESYCEGNADIRSGDIFVVGSTEYNIRFVENYDWRGTPCLHLMIEVKR
jgi:hypothetical protein